MKTFNLPSIILLCSILLSSLMMSCSGSRASGASEEQINELKNLVETKQFTIVSDVAYPRNTFAMNQIANSGLLGPGNNISRISLIGNPNFLTLNGENVESDLPYFGERQAGSAYSLTDIGIDLDSGINDYESEWDARKGRYVVTFRARSNNESYRVLMHLYPNMNATMILVGIKRFSIEYRGQIVKELEEG